MKQKGFTGEELKPWWTFGLTIMIPKGGILRFRINIIRVKARSFLKLGSRRKKHLLTTTIYLFFKSTRYVAVLVTRAPGFKGYWFQEHHIFKVTGFRSTRYLGLLVSGAPGI